MAAQYSDPRYSLTLKFSTQSTGKSATRTINYINLDKMEKGMVVQQYGYTPTQVEAFKTLYAAAAYDMILGTGEYVSANYLLEGL